MLSSGAFQPGINSLAGLRPFISKISSLCLSAKECSWAPPTSTGESHPHCVTCSESWPYKVRPGQGLPPRARWPHPLPTCLQHSLGPLISAAQDKGMGQGTDTMHYHHLSLLHSKGAGRPPQLMVRGSLSWDKWPSEPVCSPQGEQEVVDIQWYRTGTFISNRRGRGHPHQKKGQDLGPERKDSRHW